MQSLNDAQAFEDARFSVTDETDALVFPLAARMRETENEAWDDLVSFEEISPISRTIVDSSAAGAEDALPVSLAVDTKTILVGLSNSSILVFDHFGVQRGTLLASSSLSDNAVTSLDSFQNSLVVAGYADGSVILFEDGQRVLELMSAVNNDGNAVFTTKFVSKSLILVMDCHGSGYLLTLSKLFLLGYSAERVCLLDGQSFGPVFACRVLDKYSGLALCCLAQTLIVKLDLDSATTSKARIVYKWPALMDNPASLCLAFHEEAMLQRNRSPAPILVRCTGAVCEALNLSTLQAVSIPRGDQNSHVLHHASFVSNTCLAILNASFQLSVLDLQTSQVVGRRDLTMVQFLPFSFPSHPDLQSFDNSILQVATNTTMTMASQQQLQIYCLGQSEVARVGISPWTVRVDGLVQSGQWMEALALAMRYSANHAENRNVADEERLCELLTQYLVSHDAPLTAEIGLVCVEYALAIRRADLIFSICLDAFAQMDKTNELLELVYSLVVRGGGGGMECELPPHFFTLLLDHVLQAHATDEELELFFLKLYVVPVFDLDRCIRLCREHKLFSALAYFYTKALLDFVAPCELALEWMRDAPTIFGYRFFLYLSYSLLGVEFPRGTLPLPAGTGSNVQQVLLDFFFHRDDNGASNEALKTCLEFDAECFLSLFQDAVFHSKRVSACLDRLLLVAPHIPAVLLFAANCMCTVRQEEGTTRRAEVFAFMHHHHPKLLIEFIQKYPEDLAWYEEQIALLMPSSSRQLEVEILLKRMRRGSSAKEDMGLVEEIFLLLLELRNSKLLLEFVREERKLLASEEGAAWFKPALAAHSQALVQFADNYELVALLFELQPEVLLQHLSDVDKFNLLKPVIGSLGAREVTLEMANSFVELLCEHEPAQAYEWLSKNEGRYNVDFALEQCTAHSIRDARAYLLERLGKVSEALDLLLSEEEELEHNLSLAIHLCTSFGSQSEWFRVLDACLEASKTSAQLVQRVLAAMMPTGCVDAETVMARLTRAEDALFLLEWFKRERTIHALARSVLREDLNRIEDQSRAHKAKAVKMSAPPSAAAVAATPRVVKSKSSIKTAEYEHLELCWNAIGDDNGAVLSQRLILGTEFALDLLPAAPNSSTVSQASELVDAGL